MTPALFHKTILWAIAVSLAVIGPVAAQGDVSVFSDLENGTNQNYFGDYWYVYDDHEDKGNSTITNQTKNTDGTYNFLPTKDEGNTEAGGTPGYGAKVAFKLGDVKPSNASASWGNMIGIGSRFAPEGTFMDLSGAKKIEFYAKVTGPAGVTGVDLRVEVCTQELDADFGYYHIIIPVTTSWAKYTVPLDTVDQGFGKLEQWDWSVTAGGAKPFNLKNVSKIQWCISEDGNVVKWADAVGTLWLDDISISPFKPHFRDEIEANKIGAPGAVGLDPKSKLADMEKTVNAAKFYSYCYTDGDNNPTPSVITVGATQDTVTKKYLLGLSDGGVANSKCASIQFEFGTPYQSGGNTVLPFVGIGTNLCNEPLNTITTDLSSGTAIYFDYKLKSDKVQFLIFEIKTNQTFGNPDAIYYVKLPGTGGEWKGATVDLKGAVPELVLPMWKDVTQNVPLNLTSTFKFQWKVQGAAHATGEFGIDNVYVPGKDFTGVRYGKNAKGATPAFAVQQTASAANISFIIPQRFNAAALELVTVQGKIIASRSIRNIGKDRYQASFPTDALASGSYLVRLNCENVVVKTAMISIVK